MCHELTADSERGRGGEVHKMAERERERAGGRWMGAANNHGNKYLLHRHQMRVFMANQTFATDSN